MKAISWLKYFVYLLLIVGVSWLQPFTMTAFETEYQTTNQFNYWLFSVGILMPILIGLILGIETLLNEIAKEGRWKLNLPKLLFMILPSLYITSLYHISFIKNETINKIFIEPVIKLFGNSSDFIILFQIVLGYSIITLLFKSKSKEVVIEDNAEFMEGKAELVEGNTEYAEGTTEYVEDNEISEDSGEMTTSSQDIAEVTDTVDEIGTNEIVEAVDIVKNDTTLEDDK